MTLDFGVLGPLQMSVDGEPVPLGTPKQPAVLAMLVMSRNRPVSSDSLVNAAWEQFPPPEPKASLHSYVSNLRRLVAGAGLDPKTVLASGLGIFFLVKPDDNKAGPTMPTASITESSERSTTSRTRTTTTTPPDDPDSFQAKLMALIPPGYPTSVCEAASPPSTGALATIDCAKFVQPGGPEAARYSIFADKDQLILHFNESIKQNDEVLRCPGADADSPIDWNYKATPDAVAGQVACGTYQGNADVMWTQYDELLLADVQSTNMDDLHNWWSNYS